MYIYICAPLDFVSACPVSEFAYCYESRGRSKGVCGGDPAIWGVWRRSRESGGGPGSPGGRSRDAWGPRVRLWQERRYYHKPLYSLPIQEWCLLHRAIGVTEEASVCQNVSKTVANNREVHKNSAEYASVVWNPRGFIGPCWPGPCWAHSFVRPCWAHARGFICWALLGPSPVGPIHLLGPVGPRALMGPFICWALLGPFIWALLEPLK